MTDRTHFFSAYQYAGNNPISGNDPTGLLRKSPDQQALMDQAMGIGVPNGYGNLDRSMDDISDDANYAASLTGGGGNYSAFWSNVVSALLSGGDGSSWTNNGDGTNTFTFANDVNENSIDAGYEPIKYNYNAQVIRDKDTQEIIKVIMDPITASPSVSFSTDEYGRPVTRTINVYGQYNNHTMLSGTSVLLTWSCYVIAVYTFRDGQTPVFTKVWSVSKQTVE